MAANLIGRAEVYKKDKFLFFEDYYRFEEEKFQIELDDCVVEVYFTATFNNKYNEWETLDCDICIEKLDVKGCVDKEKIENILRTCPFLIENNVAKVDTYYIKKNLKGVQND